MTYGSRAGNPDFTSKALEASPGRYLATTLNATNLTLTDAITGTVTGDGGAGTFNFDPATKQLQWNVNYSGLSGPVTGAHIHGPAAAGEDALRVHDGRRLEGDEGDSEHQTDAELADRRQDLVLGHVLERRPARCPAFVHRHPAIASVR